MRLMPESASNAVPIISVVFGTNTLPLAGDVVVAVGLVVSSGLGSISSNPLSTPFTSTRNLLI